MRVLVTGSHGFVGKNLLEHPKVAGWEVRRGSRSGVNLAAQMQIFQPEVVIHLAGRVGGIQANIDAPYDFLLDNLRIGLDVVESAVNAGVPRLINIGSSCMYPLDAPQPFREESLLGGPVEPTNEAYAIAKLAIMRLCQFAGYKTLIPPGIYGRHDHFDGDRSHLVGAVMHRLHQVKAEGVSTVPIWGDGTARREFLFAGDLAGCIVQAVNGYDTLPDVMNVGPGWDLSVDEWCEVIAKAVGYEGAFTHDLSKPSGQPAKVMDVSRAKEWGWEAATPPDAGLRQTYQWYLEGRSA